ncbi:MAG: hypothetical protein JKY50_21325 [Oleispira sp.]|nr:hypothetical protein [Oleispira sp.]MBL4882091.1 hypothetical protein [Oleispira sp.]
MRQLIRKQPRDFIWQDDFQYAKDDWPENYPGNKVWVNIHEYRATLAGDASYLRLLISGAHDCNLVWQTTPDGAHELQRLLASLTMPLSFKALRDSGFSYFEDADY